jgi:hypothetical protein
MGLVKCDRDGHDLAQAQLGISVTAFVTITEQVLVPQGFKKIRPLAQIE